jgi:hypothetical protein
LLLTAQQVKIKEHDDDNIEAAALVLVTESEMKSIHRNAFMAVVYTGHVREN